MLNTEDQTSTLCGAGNVLSKEGVSSSITC